MGAGDVLDTTDAFVARLMSKPRRTSYVTNRVQTIDGSGAVLVGDHVATLYAGAQRLQSQVLDVASDSQREDDNVSDSIGTSVSESETHFVVAWNGGVNRGVKAKCHTTPL
jgi:hypothetical protein